MVGFLDLPPDIIRLLLGDNLLTFGEIRILKWTCNYIAHAIRNDGKYSTLHREIWRHLTSDYDRCNDKTIAELEADMQFSRQLNDYPFRDELLKSNRPEFCAHKYLRYDRIIEKLIPAIAGFSTFRLSHLLDCAAERGYVDIVRLMYPYVPRCSIARDALITALTKNFSQMVDMLFPLYNKNHSELVSVLREIQWNKEVFNRLWVRCDPEVRKIYLWLYNIKSQ